MVRSKAPNSGRDALISARENREMFDRIAAHYDAANYIMSLGMDRRWRREAVSDLAPVPGGRYLDIGTGTGDVAFEMARQAPGARITGVDPAERMLGLARRKAAGLAGASQVTFETGDALGLPMADACLDGVISAFCYRNLTDRQAALCEMHRVLRGGGKMVVLELTHPEGLLVHGVHHLAGWLIPVVGLLAGDAAAYRYLVKSIEAFAQPRDILDRMAAAGFTNVRCRPLCGGMVSIFTGCKPDGEAAVPPNGTAKPSLREGPRPRGPDAEGGRKDVTFSTPSALVFATSTYCNAAPLAECLPDVDPCVRMKYGHPAQLLAALHERSADVALIPVADFFRDPDLVRIDGLGVAADGVVRSVLLKCNVPLTQIRTVMKDPASATSNALSELLLRRHFRREVTMLPWTAGGTADAVVMIGDRALCAAPAPAGDIDLAAAWKEFTGLPFVFAVWAHRKDHPDAARLAAIARAAYAASHAALPAIVARYAGTLRCTPEFIQEYLTRCIHHQLTSRDVEGMERFRSLLAEGVA